MKLKPNFLISFLFWIFLSSFFYSCEIAPPFTPAQELKKLYYQANRAFIHKHYRKAFKLYKKITIYYPASKEAEIAQIRMGDCKFYLGEYKEAIHIYETYMKFYPDSKKIPYILFQLGNSYYHLKYSYDRDPFPARKALFYYTSLVTEYPSSDYALKAKPRIKELKELLAKHELYVAKFYYKMKYYRAAYGRLVYLLKHFPCTSSAREARKFLLTYYQMALKETQEIKEGKKEDFWGLKVP